MREQRYCDDVELGKILSNFKHGLSKEIETKPLKMKGIEEGFLIKYPKRDTNYVVLPFEAGSKKYFPCNLCVFSIDLYDMLTKKNKDTRILVTSKNSISLPNAFIMERYPGITYRQVRHLKDSEKIERWLEYNLRIRNLSNPTKDEVKFMFAKEEEYWKSLINGKGDISNIYSHVKHETKIAPDNPEEIRYGAVYRQRVYGLGENRNLLLKSLGEEFGNIGWYIGEKGP